MAAGRTETLLQHICRLVVPSAPDQELLQRFSEQRDATAFAAVVERHGPMVLGVCRRILRHEQDAEDAFQATFLTLARKAASLRGREAVGNWLYRVACHIALKARTAATRRRVREAQATPRPSADDPASALTLREARELLDEELARLPERLRTPLVLCCLEGATRDEAAQQLGWSLGTLKRRLARARSLLRSRLCRRGLTISSALLAVLLTPERTPAAVPATLVSATVRTALSPARAAAPKVLQRPAVLSLTPHKVGALLLLAGLLTAVAGFPSRKEQPVPPAPTGDRKPKADSRRPTVDLHGDPLPEGALARMGTVRLRAEGAVVSVAFSADGKSLASANLDGPFRLWETATGKELRRFTVPQCGGGFAVALSRDGKSLAGYSGDAMVRVWSLASGKPFFWLGPVKVDVSCFALSPDGKVLAAGVTAAGSKHLVQLHDVASRKLLAEMKGHKGRISAVAFAPTGKTLASAENDGTVCLWDVATGKELRRLAGSKGRWQVLAFSPDGQHLASGSDVGKTIHLWDQRGKEIRRLPGPEGWIWSVAFTPDGKSLATAGKAVRIWDIATGKEVRRMEKVSARSVAFAPDGRTLAAGCDFGAIRLWDLATDKERFTDRGHTGWVRSAAASADGRTLATACTSDRPRLWNLQTGRELRPLTGLSGPAYHVAFAPVGHVLAVGGEDGSVGLWDARTAKPIRRLVKAHPKPVTAVTFSHDGRLLATGSKEEGVVRLWDVPSGKAIRRLLAPAVKPVAFSPDGKLLATGSLDVNPAKEKDIRLWDVASGKEVRRFEGGMLRSLCFSPDSKTLVSGGWYAPIRLWDVAMGTELRHLGGNSYENGDTRDVFRVCFSPDGRTLASAENDGAIWLWEVATGQKRRRLVGHQGSVLHVSFAGDGRTLISSGADTTALVWDVLIPPRGKPRPLEAVWADLAGQDAVRAYGALCTLIASPRRSVPLLRQHLRPVRAADPARLTQLLAELDSDRFATRQRAMRQLEQLGESATPALQKTLADKVPLETRRRIEQILDRLAAKRLASGRTLEVLEHAGTTEARELLGQLSRGLPEAALTREAKAALRRLR